LPLSLGLSFGLCSLASAFCGTSEPSEAGLSIHRSFQEAEAERVGLFPSPRQAGTRQIQVYVHVILESESDSRLQREIGQQVRIFLILYLVIMW
jgi:hypothetical protein